MNILFIYYHISTLGWISERLVFFGIDITHWSFLLFYELQFWATSWSAKFLRPPDLYTRAKYFSVCAVLPGGAHKTGCTEKKKQFLATEILYRILSSRLPPGMRYGKRSTSNKSHEQQNWFAVNKTIKKACLFQRQDVDTERSFSRLHDGASKLGW